MTTQTIEERRATFWARQKAIHASRRATYAAIVGQKGLDLDAAESAAQKAAWNAARAKAAPETIAALRAVWKAAEAARLAHLAAHPAASKVWR